MRVKVLNIELERQEVTIRKEELKKFRQYLSKGFHVYRRENGVNILRTKSKIWITVKCNFKYERINLKDQLVKFYGKMKAEKLIKKFKQDLDKHCVKLKLDSDGNYYIIKK